MSNYAQSYGSGQIYKTAVKSLSNFVDTTIRYLHLSGL